MNKLKTVGTSLCASLALILGGVLYQYNGNDILGNEVKHYESVVEKKDCTVLVYMDGSNLESSYGQASKDIEEMINYYCRPLGGSFHFIQEHPNENDPCL